MVWELHHILLTPPLRQLYSTNVVVVVVVVVVVSRRPCCASGQCVVCSVVREEAVSVCMPCWLSYDY